MGDKETGERIYLSGSRDILFDVTSLTMNYVHSSNIGVAVVLPRQDRIFVVAHRPGLARSVREIYRNEIIHNIYSIILLCCFNSIIFIG